MKQASFIIDKKTSDNNTNKTLSSNAVIELQNSFTKEPNKNLHDNNKRNNNLITKKFRLTTKKPKTIYQAIKLYVHLIKSAISRDIIISKRITKNNKKRYIYKLIEIIILNILKTISN